MGYGKNRDFFARESELHTWNLLLSTAETVHEIAKDVQEIKRTMREIKEKVDRM